jgi:hypothetical protein
MATPPPPKAKSTEEQLADIHAIIDNLVASMATMQGNQGQLTVAVNRLQSNKITASGDGSGPSHQDPIATAAWHGHKLLFLTYDGKDDPLPWLNRCGQFFRIQATEDAGKLFLASYMTGDAAQWFTLLEKNQGTPTWDEFERLVNQRFGPPIRGNALGKLIQLRRETTVADYQTRFLALVNHCKGLTEPHQIDIFTTGLRDPLKTDVELEQLVTLEEAMALARAYEHRLAMSAEPTTRLASRPAYGRTKQLAIHGPPPAAGGQTSGPAAPATEPRFKCLTVVEMAAKRAWGKCYNCTEKFSKEHLEVCPVKGICLLELDTPEPLEQLDDTSPLISLHAITGIAAAETMKLRVTIASAPITALVDSDSTHSFISTEAACHLHLEPLFRPRLQVTVTNGDRVANAGVCPNVKFFINSEEFVLDLFVIPLAGYEMVLRVQWLRTLGPILWDFTHARMRY